MAVQPASVAILQGGSATVTASITRLGDFHGDVEFSVAGVPANVALTIGSSTTSGQVSTAAITVVVGSDVPAGNYMVTVRGTGGANGVASASLTLQVTAVPAIALTLSRQSLTIIRGGIAPLTVTIARTSAPEPVTFSLTGASGITASFATNPVGGSSAEVTVAVAPTVAPGTYVLTVHGLSPSTPDRSVALTVIVPADSLQILANDAETAQATIVTSDIIVNRFGSADSLSMSAEGLPANVSASFQGGGGSETSAKVTFVVAAAAPTGTFSVTLRAHSQLMGDATTQLQLRISASRIAFTLSPQFLNLTPGSTAASSITLTRTAFAGTVMIEASTTSNGVSATVAQPNLTGNGTVVIVAAEKALAPGNYTITVRAVALPAGGTGTPALDPVSSTISIIVVPAMPVSASVVLDWSACTAPQWVAVQDGTGTWTPIAGAQGIYRFTVTATRGGFAYVTASEGLTVRYGTASELSAAPITLCAPPEPATKSIRGTAQHSGPNEQFTWRLGGGVAVSTQTAPEFTITGVREGTYDLVGTGTTQAGGYRYFLMRDVNLPAGESVGLVNLSGTNSFVPANASLGIGGLSGDVGVITTSLLSGTSCTPAELRKVGLSAITGSYSTFLYGIPPGQQRADDFHLLEVAASGGAGSSARTASVSFHTVNQRGIALPPVVGSAVQPIAGPYKRLQAQLDASITANYNGSLTLRYGDGTRSVTVTASLAALGPGALVLDLPDLSGVSGFPSATTIASNASGTWSLVLTGSNGQPLCSDGATRWSYSVSDTF